MAHTVFVDGSTVTANRIVAAWLNDADTVTYVRFGDGTSYTGNLTVPGTTSLTGALTYGGVTLSNSVTGTGSMMLAASPTTTGTLTAAAINASGLVAMAGAATVGTTLGVTGTSTMAAINASGLVTINKGSTGEHLVVGFPGTPLYHIGNDGTYAYITTSASAFGTGVLSSATQMYLTVNNAATLGLTATAATVTGTLGVTGATTIGAASAGVGALTINHATQPTIYLAKTNATATTWQIYNNGNLQFYDGTNTPLYFTGAASTFGGAVTIPGTLGVTGICILQTVKSKTGNTGSVATGVATTLFALAGDYEESYIVNASVHTADTANYFAVSLVVNSDTARSITALRTAGLMTITLSGGNVQATQISGGNATIYWNATRLS